MSTLLLVQDKGVPDSCCFVQCPDLGVFSGKGLKPRHSCVALVLVQVGWQLAVGGREVVGVDHH